MSITLDLKTMSIKEKIDLIGQLWNSIDEGNYEVPDWQMKILEARIQEDISCPDEGTPWEEFRSELPPWTPLFIRKKRGSSRVEESKLAHKI